MSIFGPSKRELKKQLDDLRRDFDAAKEVHERQLVNIRSTMIQAGIADIVVDSPFLFMIAPSCGPICDSLGDKPSLLNPRWCLGKMWKRMCRERDKVDALMKSLGFEYRPEQSIDVPAKIVKAKKRK